MTKRDSDSKAHIWNQSVVLHPALVHTDGGVAFEGF